MMRSPTPRPHALATVGKSLVSVPVHLSGLVVFRPPMQELLNIEQFYWRKFNKIETKYFKEIKALEALDEWDFLEVILNFQTYIEGDIEFWVIFVTEIF
jgi:hypothetical protein